MPYRDLRDEWEEEGDDDDDDGGGGDDDGGGGGDDEGGGGGGGDEGGGDESGGGDEGGGGGDDEGGGISWEPGRTDSDFGDSSDDGSRDREDSGFDQSRFGDDDDDDDDRRFRNSDEGDGDGFFDREQRRRERKRLADQQAYDDQQRVAEAFRKQQQDLDELERNQLPEDPLQEQQQRQAEQAQQDQRLAAMPGYQLPGMLQVPDAPAPPEAEVPTPGETRADIEWDTQDPAAWVAVRDLDSQTDRWIPVSEFDPTRQQTIDERAPTLGPAPAGSVAHLRRVGDREYTPQANQPAAPQAAAVSSPPVRDTWPIEQHQQAATVSSPPVRDTWPIEQHQQQAAADAAAKAAADATAAAGAPTEQVAQAAANAAVGAIAPAPGRTLDGQTFQQQTAWTKMAFQARYGTDAANQWAREHNAELQRNQQVYGSREPRPGDPSRVAGIGPAPDRRIGVTPPPGPGQQARFGVNSGIASAPIPKPAGPAAVSPTAGTAATTGNALGVGALPGRPAPGAPTAPSVATTPAGRDRYPEEPSGLPPATTPSGLDPGSDAILPPGANVWKPWEPSDSESGRNTAVSGDVPPERPLPSAPAAAPASAPVAATPPVAQGSELERPGDTLTLQAKHDPRITMTTTRADWDQTDKATQNEWNVTNARGASVTGPTGNSPYDETPPTAAPPRSTGPGYDTNPILPGPGVPGRSGPFAPQSTAAPVGAGAVRPLIAAYSYDEDAANFQAVPRPAGAPPRGVPTDPFDLVTLHAAQAQNSPDVEAFRRSVAGGLAAGEAWAEPYADKLAERAWYQESGGLEGGPEYADRGYVQRWKSAFRAGNINVVGVREAMEALVSRGVAPPSSDPFRAVVADAARQQGATDLQGFGRSVAGGIAKGEAWAKPYVEKLAQLAWYKESGGREGGPENAPATYVRDWTNGLQAADHSIPGVKEVNQRLIEFGARTTPPGGAFDWKKVYGPTGEGLGANGPTLISRQFTQIDCGPNAFSNIMRSQGYNAAPADAFTFAKQYGYHSGEMFNGPQAYVNMLQNELGLKAQQAPVDWNRIDQELAEGRLVTLSSPGATGHYWTIAAKNDQGQYYTGATGTFVGDPAWSRPNQITFANNPPTTMITYSGTIDPNSRAVKSPILNVTPPNVQQTPQPTMVTAPAAAASSSAAAPPTGATRQGPGPAPGREAAPQVTDVSLPDQLPTRNRVENLRALQPALEAAARRSGISAESLAAIIIAENGAGDSQDNDLARVGNNLFSIQVSEQEGPYQNGAYGAEKRFGTYKNPVDSINHFLTLVSTTPRYKEAWDNRADPEKFVAGLMKGQYIVDEARHPAAKWQQEMADYREQYRRATGGRQGFENPDMNQTIRAMAGRPERSDDRRMALMGSNGRMENMFSQAENRETYQEPSERANLNDRFTEQDVTEMRQRILDEAPDIRFDPGDDVETRMQKMMPALEWLQKEYGWNAEALAGMAYNESRIGTSEKGYAGKANNLWSTTYMPSDTQSTGPIPEGRWSAYPNVKSGLARFVGMYMHPDNGYKNTPQSRKDADSLIEGLLKDKYINPNESSVPEWKQGINEGRAMYRRLKGRQR